MKNNFKKSLLCIFLCFVMLLSVSLVSCNNTAAEGEDAGEKVDVVRLITDIKTGNKITDGMVEVVSVTKAELAEGTILNKEEVIGKFTVTDMYAGEYFLAGKLSSKRQGAESEDGEAGDALLTFDDAGYVIVSDYVKADTGEDVSDAIQKLVDENPGRTLYFPDGVYLLSKSIKTSADPEKTVSFKLGNYAHFKAMDTWASGERKIDSSEDLLAPDLKPADIKTTTTPLLHLGAKDMKEGIINSGNHYSVEGGIFDGSNKADAIWVEGAGDVSLRYISIKFAVNGIYVKGDEEGNGPTVDVHTVNIVGSRTADSIGVILESNSNTLTNMRIAGNEIAIMLSGRDNFLRNLHPLYVYGGQSEWETYYNASVAFYDSGIRNFYDNCYNDQFAVGFYMGTNTASVYDCCFNFWYRGTNNGEAPWDHIGFKAEGQYNSTIRYTSSEAGYGVVTDKYPVASKCNFLIVGEEGGQGTIDAIYVATSKLFEEREAYSDYLINDKSIVAA